MDRKNLSKPHRRTNYENIQRSNKTKGPEMVAHIQSLQSYVFKRNVLTYLVSAVRNAGVWICCSSHIFSEGLKTWIPVQLLYGVCLSPLPYKFMSSLDQAALLEIFSAMMLCVLFKRANKALYFTLKIFLVSPY